MVPLRQPHFAKAKPYAVMKITPRGQGLLTTMRDRNHYHDLGKSNNTHGLMMFNE